MIRRHDSIVVQKVARILVPHIQLFALYVFFHGHYSPGGGFQGGTLIAASIILNLLVGTEEERKAYSVRREFLVMTGGIALFAGIGALALGFGGELFDYGVIRRLAHDEAMRRYWGILIAEGGVFLVVAMTLVVIFNVLGIQGRNEDNQR